MGPGDGRRRAGYGCPGQDASRTAAAGPPIIFLRAAMRLPGLSGAPVSRPWLPFLNMRVCGPLCLLLLPELLREVKIGTGNCAGSAQTMWRNILTTGMSLFKLVKSDRNRPCINLPGLGKLYLYLVYYISFVFSLAL